MPDNFNRTTESELAEAVLTILDELPSGRASYETLRRHIPKRITLNDEDEMPSGTRPNETMWQQRLRNITSHAGAEGNYITEGYLIAIPRGLEITEAGRRRAKRHR